MWGSGWDYTASSRTVRPTFYVWISISQTINTKLTRLKEQLISMSSSTYSDKSTTFKLFNLLQNLSLILTFSSRENLRLEAFCWLSMDFNVQLRAKYLQSEGSLATSRQLRQTRARGQRSWAEWRCAGESQVEGGLTQGLQSGAGTELSVD